MVFCIIGLVIFGFLGIFSAKYRAYAKEAWRCFTRQITLRPCDTAFDKKMKAKISGKLMKISPFLSRFAYKYFALFSWSMVIMLVVSVYWMVSGFYNLSVYGTCDPHSTTCVFNPGHLHCGSEHCLEEGCTCEQVGCQAPDHKACEGNCTCREGTCG